VVNVQGDEPLVDPAAIDAVAAALAAAPGAAYATAAARLPPAEAHLPQRVKVVVDAQGFALYFSRAAIPAVRGALFAATPEAAAPGGGVALAAGAGRAPAAALPTPPAAASTASSATAAAAAPSGHDSPSFSPSFSPSSSPSTSSPAPSPYLLHLGLQAYRAPFLAWFAAAPPSPLQAAEDLEQLKVLEAGHRMRVVEVPADGAHGVDVPADLRSVEALMRRRGVRGGGA
jgi:3-deoxy-manno-octulosonate cytidylyltransferase (CMP-KDO synthetase)